MLEVIFWFRCTAAYTKIENLESMIEAERMIDGPTRALAMALRTTTGVVESISDRNQ